jgi:hypothetical protein
MIHYHGLPMSNTHDMIRAFATKHAMVSFEHPEQMEIAAEICQSVVLDNGAFSAWKSGAKYDFDGFAAWAAKWVKHPALDWCIIPDKIDGSEADNDALLKGWGLPVSVSVPVWHMHESLDRLDRLCEYPRIALGSSGEFAVVGDQKWWARMAAAMQVICDADGMPRSKLHGLRMLNPTIFSKLPLSSADSCNVARNVGIDKKWNGPYSPASRTARAIILMERIEKHASAYHWNKNAVNTFENLDLFG